MEAIRKEKWVHIIQPKINRNRKELITERNKIAEKYLQQKYAVFDGYRHRFPKEDLGISIHEVALDIDFISLAGVIVFAPGWKDDWVCKIEHEIAERSFKKIID